MHSHSFIVPKHYHEPPLDWDALERCLLDEEVILPAKGEDVARDDIRDLAQRLATCCRESNCCRERS